MISMRLSLPVLALAWLAPAVAFAETPAAIDVDLGAGVKLALVLVPKGAFTQGSPPSEPGRSDDERAHPVTLSNDVYIGKYPVTRGQFARFVTATGYKTEAEKGTSGGSGWDGTALVQRREFTWKSPGFAQTDDHPVTIVTYDDALAFTGWLTRTSGRAFTLPTEAQWERAYRVRSTTAYYDAKSDALALGWFKPNAGNGTRPVGQRTPNALGLYDLAGNVNEWCLDWYAPYGLEAATDPVATTPDASDKPRRVLRGGSWLKDVKSGRAAARYRNTPGTRNADNGFRVAAGTSLAAPTPSLPVIPPATPAERPPASTPPSRGGGIPPIGYVFMAGCMGTLALCAWMIATIFRTKKKIEGSGAPSRSQVNHRLARDGFWLDTPPHLAGSLVSYRYSDANGEMHDGQVRVEGAPNGQYVYTGHAPAAMLALQIIGMASGVSSRPSRTSQPSRPSRRAYDPSYTEPSTPSNNDDVAPFRGYPSAY